MKKITYIVLAFSALLVGCAKSKQESTNVIQNVRGDWITERNYENEHFGIAIKIPDEWELNKGKSEFIEEGAADFLAGDDKNLKAVMKTAIEKTFTVFWAYRYPLGTPGKPNPNVSMIIENLNMFPGISSAEDYLMAMEDTLKLSNKNISFGGAPVIVEMGGVEFWMRETSIPMGGLNIRQKIHARMIDGYVLLIGVTTISEEDEETVSAVTGSIQKIKR